MITFSGCACQINCNLYYQCSFMPKFMLHNHISNFHQVHIYQQIFGITAQSTGGPNTLVLLGLPVQILRSSWTPRGYSYFSGGPVISEGVQTLHTTVKKLDRGVQILRSSWTGGELFQEVRFFRDRSICTSGSNLKDMLRRRHNYGLVATMRMSS